MRSGAPGDPRARTRAQARREGCGGAEERGSCGRRRDGLQ